MNVLILTLALLAMSGCTVYMQPAAPVAHGACVPACVTPYRVHYSAYTQTLAVREQPAHYMPTTLRPSLASSEHRSGHGARVSARPRPKATIVEPSRVREWR